MGAEVATALCGRRVPVHGRRRRRLRPNLRRPGPALGRRPEHPVPPRRLRRAVPTRRRASRRASRRGCGTGRGGPSTGALPARGRRVPHLAVPDQPLTGIPGRLGEGQGCLREGRAAPRPTQRSGHRPVRSRRHRRRRSRRGHRGVPPRPDGPATGGGLARAALHLRSGRLPDRPHATHPGARRPRVRDGELRGSRHRRLPGRTAGPGVARPSHEQRARLGHRIGGSVPLRREEDLRPRHQHGRLLRLPARPHHADRLAAVVA